MRKKLLRVRILKSMRQKFDDLANKHEVSLSDMVRRLVDREATRTFEPKSLIPDIVSKLPRKTTASEDDCYVDIAIRTSDSEHRTLKQLAEHYGCTFVDLVVALCMAEMMKDSCT